MLDLTPRHSRRALSVAQIRRMIPTAAYLHFLHQGVMTGFLPRFTPEGQQTGQFDNLSPRDRMDLARYILDKVVPDAPKEVSVSVQDDPAAVDAKALRALSAAELRAIAYPEAQAQAPDLDSPMTEVPCPTPPHQPTPTPPAA